MWVACTVVSACYCNVKSKRKASSVRAGFHELKPTQQLVTCRESMERVGGRPASPHLCVCIVSALILQYQSACPA